MLAQSFKTAAELGIEERELDALIKTLGMMERGEIRHVIPTTDILPLVGGTGFFNMAHWGETHSDCGSVCCIGGTAERIMGESFLDDRPLEDLFYPSDVGDWEQITVEHAATALRNFLTTGDPQWPSIALSSGK